MNCTNVSRCSDIDYLYNYIIDVFHEATIEAIGRKKAASHNRVIAGWNV